MGISRFLSVAGIHHLTACARLAILSATGYAAVALMGRSLSGVCHPIHSTAVSFLTGAFILLPFATLSGHAINYSGEVVGLLLYLGLIPTAIGYLLFFHGINFISAPTASILTMLEPLVAVLLAWLLFSERLGPVAFIGVMLLFAAITVLYKGEQT